MSENQANSNGNNKSIITVGPRGLQLTTLDDMWRFAQFCVASKIGPESPAEVIVIVQYGAELGLPPVTSLRCIFIVNNKPAVYGDMMLALCMRHPDFDHEVFHEEWEGEGDNLKAVCIVGRKGRKHIVRREFSWKDATAAGLASRQMYRQWGRRLLQMRARAFALRDTFPDVLQGLYAVEELEQINSPSETEKPRTASDQLAEALRVIRGHKPQQGEETQDKQHAEPATECSQVDQFAPDGDTAPAETQPQPEPPKASAEQQPEPTTWKPPTRRRRAPEPGGGLWWAAQNDE